MARSELTSALKRARELHDYVQALTDDERNYLRDLLDPEPEQAAKPVKKRKRAKGSKSPRASSLAGAIAGTAGSKPVLCAYEFDGAVCKGAKDDAIHDKGMGYAGYHEFQPAATQAASGG